MTCFLFSFLLFDTTVIVFGGSRKPVLLAFKE